MRILDESSLNEVSGAAYITADYVSVPVPTIGIYDHMSITLTNDGTLPPEFQARIDAGASWEEMAPFLTMYAIILEVHPELFQ